MKLAVTGANGFLGWHVRCRAYAMGLECVAINRDAMADPDDIGRALRGVDAVIHCAGVNRGPDNEITDGIVSPARRLTEAIARSGRPVRVVYTNSTQAADGSVYGSAKRHGADILAALPGLSDVVLPNLYGEHGRAHYNSFVATFCHELAREQTPRVLHDRELALLHAQDAAEILIREAGSTGHQTIRPEGERIAVSRVLALLREFAATYRTGELPDITSAFRVRLFNTYRSHLAPTEPIAMLPRTDERGTLVECVRTETAGGQAFISSTQPGAVRGEHVHLRKFERFLVVSGEVEISLRRLYTDEIVRFRVSGDRPAAVDMPTMWAHKMTNVGDTPATTFFWTNELFNADDPDTFACPVDTLVQANRGELSDLVPAA
jgi:UDP-2-acetamido-2,6-beta-L-arabino-hexul-4-ose reductase